MPQGVNLKTVLMAARINDKYLVQTFSLKNENKFNENYFITCNELPDQILINIEGMV